LTATNTIVTTGDQQQIWSASSS